MGSWQLAVYEELVFMSQRKDKFEWLTKHFDLKIFLISIGFTLLVSFWETLVLGVFKYETYSFYFQFISVFNYKYIAFLVAVSLAHYFFLTIFVYATISSTKLPKICLLLIFFVAILFEYGYAGALGRFSETVDLEIASLTTGSQKLGAILVYLNWAAIIPCFALAVISFLYKPKRIERSKLIFLIPLGLSLCFYSLMAVKIKKYLEIGPTLPTVAASNFFETTVDYPISQLMRYRGKREEVIVGKSAISPQSAKKNIVLVVEEAVRADHMSLYGYERKTTPYLEELTRAGRITKFKPAVSGTTGSVSSGLLFLTGMRIKDLPDKEQRIYKLPSIFQFAKAMGYKTHFFDGQTTTFWNGTSRDLEFVDVWLNETYFLDITKSVWDIDFEIARKIKEITRSSNGNFIWVWKRGVHYPYYDDFPTNRAKYNPISYSVQDRLVGREELQNTYDSGIAYNIDKFFSILEKEFESDSNNVMIYTSDHGESLLDDGFTRTHGGHNKEQALVPLLMIGADTAKARTDVLPSHENIFATLLDLMEVPKSSRNYAYGNSLLDPNARFSEKRYYWGLDLTKGQPIPFD